MKTSKNSTAKDISQVVTKFLENKSDFSLDCDEKGNLYTLLMDELLQLMELHLLQVIDINCFNRYETTYYTFTFDSLITLESLEKYESDHRETELFSNLYISETINKL